MPILGQPTASYQCCDYSKSSKQQNNILVFSNNKPEIYNMLDLANKKVWFLCGRGLGIWSSTRGYIVSSDDNLSSHSQVDTGFKKGAFKIKTVEGGPLLAAVGSRTFLKLSSLEKGFRAS